MALPLAEVATQVWLFVGAGLISLVAFASLILPTAVSAYGRTWEKATAVVLSVFILAALLLVGFGIGAFIFYHWDTISTWLG